MKGEEFDIVYAILEIVGAPAFKVECKQGISVCERKTTTSSTPYLLFNF